MSRLFAPEALPGWVLAEPERLLAFARSAGHPAGGFGWLDHRGRLDPDRPVETWITGRMTHVFALAAISGREDCRAQVERGVAALSGLLADDQHGGWFSSATGSGPVVDEKRAYDQAFVTLASASASAAGIAGARELLNRALSVFENRFWESGPGLAVDVWNRDWTELEAYRGANANMHTVEALLAAGDVTGERIWAERAAGIVESLIHGVAREYHWRLPEHFDEHWTVLPEFNRNEPAHPFRPYGVTIGHLFEWARLCLHVRHALGESAPDWLLADAKDLFAVGIRDGWEVDGAPGFVYTTDFDGAPVIRSRLHWVVTEALATAWTLLLTTGEQDYQTWFERWCDYAERYFVDRADGSWHHELDASNQPAATVWEGKPDVYHAFQATLLPRLPLCSSLAGGLLANAT